jgi:hypothetical protein
MIQKVGPQKYRKIYFKIILSYLSCSQVWLNLPVEDHRHFGYNTKLTPKNK